MKKIIVVSFAVLALIFGFFYVGNVRAHEQHPFERLFNSNCGSHSENDTCYNRDHRIECRKTIR